MTLSDDVLKLARQKATAENHTLKDEINDAVRMVLTLDQRHDQEYRFRLKTGNGRPLPGVDLTVRDKLLDLMDGR